MEAPDVIYLHKIRDEESSGYYSQWFDSRARCVPSEKYIRKEALMEWIQEVRSIPHENAITRDLAFQEVVNYLNTM